MDIIFQLSIWFIYVILTNGVSAILWGWLGTFSRIVLFWILFGNPAYLFLISLDANDEVSMKYVIILLDFNLSVYTWLLSIVN